MSSPFWQPKNDTERAMAGALVAGEHDGFFRALLDAELYFPQVIRAGSVVRETEQEWVPVTRDVAGHPAVPVFTSLPGMASAMPAARYGVARFAEIREQWAGPGWWVAVNPGSPIDAYLPFDAIERLASGELAIVDGQLVPAGGAGPAARDDGLGDDLGGGIDGAEPLDDIEPARVLSDPAHPRTREQYVAALLDATVIVPTSREADFPDELLTPEFPWLRSGPDHAPTIEVFTDEHHARTRAGMPHVRMPFLLLMLAWPEGHSLVVNPGSPAGLACSPDEVSRLQQQAIAG